ncbi:LamG-like jellyroll fold domain-containing protein [Cellulosimicrobium cellulans]|uniref:LamG-like jellyroll fold domain-containing protein n=1 Tax=Cellulosimicrobium cellulans TaxID=1710 RepID=UPI00382DA40A
MAAGNWGAGHTGSGLSSVGGAVAVPSKAGLETAQRTLMFWGKYADVGGSWRWPAEFFAVGPDTCTWGIMPANGSGNLYARIRIGGVNTNIELAATGYTDWHHYAITYDGTTFRAYRDGVQVGSQAVSGTIDTCDTVRIHAYGGTNLIDDLRFYNTALTVVGQIQDAMNTPVV